MPGRLSLSPSIAAPARRVAASSNGAQRTHALCVPHASGQVLTVEATGLLPAMFVGKALQLPVVFARKSRQMGVADSYQTSYKPSTKSSIQDIFVSTEVPSTRGAPAKPQPPSTTPPPPNGSARCSAALVPLVVLAFQYLNPGDRCLIIDDFLAGGTTADALIRLCRMAGASVVGGGFLIEKTNDAGRAFLSGYQASTLIRALP